MVCKETVLVLFLFERENEDKRSNFFWILTFMSQICTYTTYTQKYTDTRVTLNVHQVCAFLTFCMYCRLCPDGRAALRLTYQERVEIL